MVSVPQPVTIAFGRVTAKDEELSAALISMAPVSQSTTLLKVKTMSLFIGTPVLSS